MSASVHGQSCPDASHYHVIEHNGNTKVLLCECKRHNACRIVSAHYADLSPDREGGGWARGLPHPVLDQVGVSHPVWTGGVLPSSLNGGGASCTWMGYPLPDLGWGTPIWTWDGLPPVQTWDGIPAIWTGNGVPPSGCGMGYPLSGRGMGYPYEADGVPHPSRCELTN